MGGNAFPHLSMVRVKREDVFPTVHFVVNTLNLPGFDMMYAAGNLMGSAGKQDDSGDLDFAMNNRKARFFGEFNLPVFDLRQVAARCREVLPEGHVSTKTLKGGQFQSAWPVAGDPAKGYVQVDFVAGDPEWLKFSHYSPGKDLSPWKGVMMSTMLGVVAKMHKDLELFDSEGVRYARVGLHFDLELGLHRKWKLRLRPGQGLSSVDPDVFETKVDAPRFARLGYVTNPQAVVQMLFGPAANVAELVTFEDTVRMVRRWNPERFEEAKERFLEAFTRSAGANDYNVEDVRHSDVWNS